MNTDLVLLATTNKMKLYGVNHMGRRIVTHMVNVNDGDITVVEGGLYNYEGDAQYTMPISISFNAQGTCEMHVESRRVKIPSNVNDVPSMNLAIAEVITMMTANIIHRTDNDILANLGGAEATKDWLLERMIERMSLNQDAANKMRDSFSKIKG